MPGTPESDVRAALNIVVRDVGWRHEARMSHDAQRRMDMLLDEAARRINDEPERANEAELNIKRFIDHSATLSSGYGTDSFEIDEGAIERALSHLCPLWPIC
jgi:hypothetical protein